MTESHKGTSKLENDLPEGHVTLSETEDGTSELVDEVVPYASSFYDSIIDDLSLIRLWRLQPIADKLSSYCW